MQLSRFEDFFLKGQKFEKHKKVAHQERAGLKIKQETVFTSPEDIHLKYIREISSCLTDDWHLHTMNFHMSEDVPLDQNTTSIEIAEHAKPSEKNLESCDESMVHFVDNKGRMHDDCDDENAENNKE